MKRICANKKKTLITAAVAVIVAAILIPTAVNANKHKKDTTI